jgi:hypothetical protein
MDLLLIFGAKFLLSIISFSVLGVALVTVFKLAFYFLWVFSNNAMPSSSGSTWSRHLLGTTSRICCASL